MCSTPRQHRFDRRGCQEARHGSRHRLVSAVPWRQRKAMSVARPAPSLAGSAGRTQPPPGSSLDVRPPASRCLQSTEATSSPSSKREPLRRRGAAGAEHSQPRRPSRVALPLPRSRGSLGDGYHGARDFRSRTKGATKGRLRVPARARTEGSSHGSVAVVSHLARSTSRGACSVTLRWPGPRRHDDKSSRAEPGQQSFSRLGELASRT
jgi:hypothetical protein